LDENGELLRLDDQDRSKWNAQMIERGLVELILAASGTELSEYHLQAGIAACHCTAPDYASTNWPRILELYDQLIRIKPSPIVALNRAVAVAAVHGAQAGLDALAAIAQRDRLDSYYLLHAVRGEFLSRLNDHPAAAEAYERAAKQAKVGPEQLYLRRMMEHAQRK
jgi:RNA polymerase sigma-70 factor (ECF subfamily)